MDGLISCLRVYSEAEFFELVRALQAGEMGEDVAALATNEYEWSWKRAQGVKVPLIGAIGRAGTIITYEAHPKRKTA